MRSASPEGPPLITLILEEDKPEAANALRRGLAGLAHVQVNPTASPTTAGASADALYISFMAGQELGAQAVFGQAQVLPSRPEDRAAGWPSNVVVGIALTPEDAAQVQPTEQFRPQLRAILEAIAQFSEGRPDPIRRVRGAFRWMAPSDLEEEAAGRVIREVYKELWPSD